MLLQLAFVLIAIIIGARIGGIGLGVLGGLGLGILTFGFGLQPTSPPIDVMLMIVAVIAAASCMQAAGGLDLMVKWAEKLLRKNPQRITILSPLVTYLFTFIAGTGHVAYSVLPVIAEVATETKIRPERPMAIAVIAEAKGVENQMKAALSVSIFVLATIAIVIFGSMESLRPVFTVGTEKVSMQMSHIIEVLMLTASAFILLFTKTDGIKAAQGSVFSAGMQAVVAIFGIAWMGDTFIAGNMTELKGSIEHIVTQMPWLFGLALFVMSILLFSQAATIRALLPLGIALGISPYMLIALFPAVNGYFFIPNYPTVVAAINFDRTGTTRIGKYILNHSFMMPGLIATGVSVGLGLLFIQFI